MIAFAGRKRTLTALYDERPAWLDLAAKKRDAAVAEGYGWPVDLTDEQGFCLPVRRMSNV